MASSNENTVRKVYQSIIDDVIQNVREQFLDEGLDEQFLFEMKNLWEMKLNAYKVFQADDTPTARLPIIQSQTHTAESSIISAINALPASHVPTNVMQTIQQKTTDSQDKSSQDFKKNLINNQIDGNDDIDSSDEDDDVDDEDDDPIGTHASSPDVFDDDDEDDEKVAQTNNDAKEDPDPLNSSDDVSDQDVDELFDTDNVIICQYEKLTRIKTRWKFHLKDGVMNINGKDYLFAKATGEADW